MSSRSASANSTVGLTRLVQCTYTDIQLRSVRIYHSPPCHGPRPTPTSHSHSTKSQRPYQTVPSSLSKAFEISAIILPSRIVKPLVRYTLRTRFTDLGKQQLRALGALSVSRRLALYRFRLHLKNHTLAQPAFPELYTEILEGKGLSRPSFGI